MRVFFRTFQNTRLLVALALLLSANGPFLQYACGDTGEALSTSGLVVMMGKAETDAAPCGLLSEDLHDRLCTDDPSAVRVCEEDACTTDTVEPLSVARADVIQVRRTLLSPPDLFSVEGKEFAPRLTSPSSGPSGAAWATRSLDRIPVRFRTLSFRL